jgi:membrane fusion protein, multidrug efflux system
MASATLETLNLQAAAPSHDLELAAELVDANQPASRPTHSPGRRWLPVFALLALTAGVLAARWWLHVRSHVQTDNAYIAGNIHQISSRISGTVVGVQFNDNQRVAAGRTLLELDPRDADLRVEQARSQLAQADAHLAQAQSQLAQARAQQAQTEAKSAKAAAELEKARLDFERAYHLKEDGRFAAISKQEYDAANAAYEVAQASAKVAQADLRSSQAALQSAQAAQAAAQAQRRTAEVSLADAQLQRSYTMVPAPVTGTVGRKSVEVGQRVQPSQALAAIVADDKWVVANFKETQLAHMRPAQPVAIRIDSIPGRAFAGTIESFAPASGAQFALLPPDNATGNFTKVVQRIPVKIVFDPLTLKGFESRVVPGLSAVVDVNVGKD